MRHLHVVFTIILFLLILAVLLLPQAGNGGGAVTRENALERTYDEPAQGLVCCTWQDAGVARRCVAAAGQTCDVCANVC